MIPDHTANLSPVTDGIGAPAVVTPRLELKLIPRRAAGHLSPRAAKGAVNRANAFSGEQHAAVQVEPVAFNVYGKPCFSKSL